MRRRQRTEVAALVGPAEEAVAEAKARTVIWLHIRDLRAEIGALARGWRSGAAAPSPEGPGWRCLIIIKPTWDLRPMSVLFCKCGPS
jgi:hypothetical protein